MKNTNFCRFLKISAVAASLLSIGTLAHAGDDVRVLLEILLEKGIITQDEFDKKLKKVAEVQEAKEASQAQEVRKATQAVEQRAESERKFKAEFYGGVSAGYYQASNMKNSSIDAQGMSDQPKGNNKIGVKVARELDADVQAVVTLESNFSTRTGAIGRDAAASGSNNGAVFDREANFRLISKNYGSVILGRGATFQNELSGAFDSRENWNFGGLKPIARYAGFHSASGLNRADKLLRYVSPSFNGLKFDVGVSYGGIPGEDEQGTSYYGGARYKNGGFEIAYNHIEARLSHGSPVVIPSETNNRVDFVAAKYSFEKLTLNAGYVITRNPQQPGATLSTSTPGGKADTDTYFVGAVYSFVPTLSANVGLYQVKDKTSTNGANDVRMAAAGLMWSPYKDWSFFADYAAADRKAGATAAFSLYDAWRPDTSASATLAAGKANQAGVSVGAMYKF